MKKEGRAPLNSVYILKMYKRRDGERESKTKYAVIPNERRHVKQLLNTD